MKLSSSLRTTVLATLLGFAGIASAATSFSGTSGVNTLSSTSPLSIDGPAHVTYTVVSKNAAYSNVFLAIGDSIVQLAVGGSTTLYNVMAGALNFGFATTAPTTANFYNNPVYNVGFGSDQIQWKITGLTSAMIGFEDISLGNRSDRDYNDLIVTASLSPVPLPGAALLFGTALLSGAAARRKKQKQLAAGNAVAA